MIWDFPHLQEISRKTSELTKQKIVDNFLSLQRDRKNYIFKDFLSLLFFYFIDDHDCTTLQWNDSSDGGKNAISSDENNQ